MTISLIATGVILAIGAMALWFLFASLRARPAAPTQETPEAAAPAPEPEWHGALNLYLAAPERLPGGAARVELSLIEASLMGADGNAKKIFEGSRRLTLQQGVTEKILSELIPNGRWTRLKLTFSPVADLAYADGRPAAGGLLERREALLSFDADVPASRTLALFARAPLEPEAGEAAGATTLNLAAEPRPAERYVLGGFLIDPRGRGDVWSIETPSLAAVVKADLGLDITRRETGSSGFVPADEPPSVPNP